MLKLFNGLNILTKMYVSEPANLHIFYAEICRCGEILISVVWGPAFQAKRHGGLSLVDRGERHCRLLQP
jgi:hypothetical protein